MILIVATLYLVITFLLTLFGIERQHEGVKIFIISLLLTPLIGMAYIVLRKSNFSKVNFYYCKECDYIFPVRMKNCPICEENGFRVRLKKYDSPYKAYKHVLNSNLV